MHQKIYGLEATPEYGWGWRKGKTSVEVPANFHIQIDEIELDGQTLRRAYGKVSQPSHPLDGFWIAVLRRAMIGTELHCDLLIKKSEPPWREDHRLYTDDDTMTGHARISNSPGLRD